MMPVKDTPRRRSDAVFLVQIGLQVRHVGKGGLGLFQG